MNQKITLTFYNAIASIYDKLEGKIFFEGRNEAGNLISKIKPYKALEVGVGTGLMFPYYNNINHLIGLDISPKMLDIAANKISSSHLLNIELNLYDGKKIPYEDNSFDCVILPYVYSVVEQPREFILECLRVCNTGGSIIIINHFSNTTNFTFWTFLEKIFSPIHPMLGFRTKFDYTEHISKYNFNIKEVKSVNFFNLSKIVHIVK